MTGSPLCSGSHPLRSLSAAAAAALILFCSSVAGASLSGDASLTYTAYDGHANGSNSMSSRSLVQNYSLLYSSGGPVYNSRVGNYNVSLGYNWTALDTTLKSSTQPTENYNLSRGHILYKGEINLDPKEIPLRLNAYSRDMTSNSILNSNGIGRENFSSFIGDHNQQIGINDGLHIESGATLVAGVKNGMTNGYNEVLRNFPMILLDYKDSIIRDLRSINPVDTRLSRLAFVSLNKKDNWFHYRHIQFDDYLYTSNNYVENEIQLGTVDQNMERRWIDFTNWLKVSTDLQLSRRKSNYERNPIEDINLNAFVAAERQSWNMRSFTSFNRHKDEANRLSYETSLPLYASGLVSQDISWNARTSFRDNHDVDALGVRSNFTTMLVGYRLDAFRRAPFTLSQSFDVESSQSLISNYLTLSGGLETTSTPRFSRDVTLGASYNIKNAAASSSTDSTSNFFEQKLDLRGGYSFSNILRFDVRENIIFTKGNLPSFNETTRNSGFQLGQSSDFRNAINSEGYHSLTTAAISWNPKPRLNIHLTMDEDVYKFSGRGVANFTEVRSGILFSNNAWSVSDTITYNHGDRAALDENADFISNYASLNYIYSRNFDAGLKVSYSTSYSTAETVHYTDIEQRANYNIFTKSGIIRKLLEFNETLAYSSGAETSSHEFRKGLMLGFKYYPISRLTLAGGVGASYVTSPSDYTLIWNASAVANFKLLQASLDYVSGIRKLDSARENRFTGNIRKSF